MENNYDQNQFTDEEMKNLTEFFRILIEIDREVNPDRFTDN
jgi:hypothetical protein